MAAAALPIILLMSEQPLWLTALTKLLRHQVSCSTLSSHVSCLLAPAVGTMLNCPHGPLCIHHAAHPVALLPACPGPRATNFDLCKEVRHAGHGNASMEVWNSQEGFCDTWPAPSHGTSFAAQDHHERKSL